MKITVATQIGCKYACQHFTKDIPPLFKYAYNVWIDSDWIGAVLFRETDGSRFDKWADQVAEMIVAVSSEKEESVAIAIETLKKKCLGLI